MARVGKDKEAGCGFRALFCSRYGGFPELFWKPIAVRRRMRKITQARGEHESGDVLVEQAHDRSAMHGLSPFLRLFAFFIVLEIIRSYIRSHETQDVRPYA